ncbi:MAG: hypothetical protein HYU41_01385, partial [Candidatus Rokubacteria bacterium]|nr:hypothetical protein [Candidatus Rokubacteria bacterium]
GFSVGGSRTSPSGGTGTLNVDGAGTLIRILGSQKGFNVGFDRSCLNDGPCNQPSTGTMTVSRGAQVLTGSDNRASIGSTPASTGTVTVTDAGSLIDAGAFLGIGRDRDGNPGGTGTLTLTMGGTVKATTINCGAGGTINGDGGTLIGEVIADPACVIAPGFSPGTLNIVGNFSNLGARIVLEVDAFGNHDVLAVEGTAAFDAATEIEVRIHPAYQPVNGATLSLVQVQATPQQAPQMLLTVTVSDAGGATVQTTGDLTGQPIAVVADDSIQPAVRAVTIDVKPGDFPNVVNLGSSGTIPVAVFSTPEVEALTVDPTTIRLNGASVKLAGKTERPLCSSQDVNGDGRADLVCHVVTSELPVAGDSAVILDAMTFRGTSGHGIPIRGMESIKIVP